jgi:hypothetical protein
MRVRPVDRISHEDDSQGVFMTHIHSRCYGRLHTSWIQAVVLSVALALLAGCQITLVSAYDPEIDHAATTLQKKMDGYLTELQANLGTAAAQYEQNKPFYEEYMVDLRSVMIRAESHPDNTLTVKQLKLMMDNLDQLRTLHQAGPLSTEVIDTTRDLFNQGWRAIITLELAKRRGES